MKLTSEQVTRTTNQVQVQALPDSHAAVPHLKETYGEHTFLVDNNGLNILEPADDSPPGAVKAAVVISLADWSDDTLTRLIPHEPVPTGETVELVPMH
jgi:hypothetical protein